MFLSIKQLRKSFGREAVVEDLSCGLEAHQTLSILGRSGCGKTTLLKIIAGLETADTGSIRLNDREITNEEPQAREVVYLYQEPLLFPHLDVWNNIAFGLRLRNIEPRVIRERVGEMMENIGLTRHTSKMPHQLSGGQRQRVAFGRAIIVNPRLLLLDEPFASLDVEIRASMQQLFKDLTRRFEITSIFVTHDLKEALLMGDRIAYMHKGMLKMYPSKDSFIHDPEVGVLDEIAFWTGLVRSAKG